ncbi:MAG: hypothetical protein CMH28_01850 [Micavibrio sp.]|nr:hypothetical protein [Micavibrio sp.]|tara:strand:+ start:816 stop:4955 length:4140 start_codon:yes stop_codon:yes gene_type:complete
MEKTLGLDLGTNSIGAALRVGNEFDWFGVKTFKKGVGTGKSGEFSLAAERTGHRSKRRLYNAKRYRKWETLKVLIEARYCPLSIEELHKWKRYEKGVGRVYPIENKEFDQWIKLDFDGDGTPDFSSPYQLRRLLIQEKFDLSDKRNKQMLGRAFYHIAQRRGFKSSRKGGDKETSAIHEGSSETDAVPRDLYKEMLTEYRTLGAALAKLEDDGIRIRNRYTLRKDYEEEIKKIAEVQELDEQIREKILKAIFFQRPLRSQKGLVGKCTLEPMKAKCSISHPQFELYRAWAFINNLEFYDFEGEEWIKLPIEWKRNLLNDCFLKVRTSFKFGDIRKNLNKQAGTKLTLNYDVSQGRIDKQKNLSSVDKVSVSGCPVAGRFKSVLGENWHNWSYETTRTNKLSGESKEETKIYSIDDLWHVLFSFEDEEYFEEYCFEVLDFNEDKRKQLLTLWKSFPVGYASLSLKAINNILPFLEEGLIYTEAVLLAKIPELIGKEKFQENKELLIQEIRGIIKQNRLKKRVLNIANNLISQYYLLEHGNGRFAHKDYGYKLADSDKRDVAKACVQHFGEKRWEKMEDAEKESTEVAVQDKYQEFFTNPKRMHFKLPRLIDHIQEFLADHFELDQKQLKKLYHPSQIDIYPESRPADDGKCYLGSPKTGAFKNPMAMRTMHELRSLINKLIEDGKIDEETRIVVETARSLNYANMRWAIEKHQRDREKENKEFAIAISELIKDSEFQGQANPNSKSDIDKFRLWVEQIEDFEKVLKVVSATKEDVEKYYHWKEQGCRCMYTGEFISITDLFDTNKVDFEHTIPRSISFDNSLANRTVAYASYNRNVKGNKLPTELPNYWEDTKEGKAIKPRLETWENRLKSYKEKIERAKAASKGAQDKDSKDQNVRRKHIAQLEYDYWKNKLDRFTREDVPTGWKNSQLIDTQIVSKYAFHYLKSVFNRVDVQKGSNTAEFRKIYQIQDEDKKDRGKHSHHAVDAAVLTLIPSPSKMKEILYKAYMYYEKNSKQYTEKPFEGFHQSQITEIEDKILINQKSKDQALASGSKKVRKRGKIEYLRDANGEFRLDEEGKRIPKIATGDSIRGQLHLDTFYGKIKVVERNPDGTPRRNEDGELVFEKKNGEHVFWMVERVKVSDSKLNLKNVVDPLLRQHMEKQIKNGRKLNELEDFNGKIIRHVRCKSHVTEPITLKKHTYKSKHPHKQSYYVANGENYGYAFYEGLVNGKLHRDYEIIRLMDLAVTNRGGEATVLPAMSIGKDTKIPLRAILKPGQRVLFYQNTPDELGSLNPADLSKRFYKVVKFEKDGRIVFEHHSNAKDDNALKELAGEHGKSIYNGFSTINFEAPWPKLKLSRGNLDLLIECVDFDQDETGKLTWKG